MLLLLAAYVFWIMLRGELSVYAGFATTRSNASAAASGGSVTPSAGSYTQYGPATFSPGAASGADGTTYTPLFGGIGISTPLTSVPTSTGAQTETSLGAWIMNIRKGIFGT